MSELIVKKNGKSYVYYDAHTQEEIDKANKAFWNLEYFLLYFPYPNMPINNHWRLPFKEFIITDSSRLLPLMK